ncbi:SLC13 family permease [Hydrogenimonas urashimensis]|uniref:SLC13 family permease n=1 Tax=Hydrogenimonas urashimensis TaxID=2740515 RepID=UPI001915C727|nr:SLC13 family permease [Hydrogenimonas urashimensis]
MGKRLIRFLIDEWLLLISLAGLAATSLYLKSWPLYTEKEMEPIFLLFALFVVVKGIENSQLLGMIARVLEKRGRIPLLLVVVTFVLSMFVTIDVALVTVLPIVMAMNIREKENLVILVALTAHAGAALTPFGTPQNIFIFSYYELQTIPFIQTIAPFSFGMLLLFAIAALFLKNRPNSGSKRKKRPISQPLALIYGVLLLIVVLCVLRILPTGTALLALVFALFFDRKSLKVDYALLLTFIAFLGLTTNIQAMIGASLEHPMHIFILSSLMSQVISNVPTTLLMEKFTSNWQALLWGTNVGGFGTLVAALANLITYRIYVAGAEAGKSLSFVRKFVGAGFVAFFAGYAIFYLFY